MILVFSRISALHFVYGRKDMDDKVIFIDKETISEEEMINDGEAEDEK